MHPFLIEFIHGTRSGHLILLNLIALLVLSTYTHYEVIHYMILIVLLLRPVLRTVIELATRLLKPAKYYALRIVPALLPA